MLGVHLSWVKYYTGHSELCSQDPGFKVSTLCPVFSYPARKW